MKKDILYGIVIIATSIVACNSGNDNSKMQSKSSKKDSSVLVEKRIKKTQNIFFNIPSPIQTASVLKKSGASYNGNLLNPYQNVDKYSSTTGKSLNLGVYATDVSFASIFNQTQSSIHYIKSCKKLADDLGITGIYTPNLLSRLNKNINNKDSVLDIIAKSYWRANATLKEQGETSHKIMAYALIGGWAEGLYLGTQMYNDTTNVKLGNVIERQKYSLNELLSLLNTYQSDSSIAKFKNELKDLQNIFNEIKSTKYKSVSTSKTNKGKIVISGGSKLKYSPEVILKIKKKAALIRNEVVQYY